MDKQGYDFEPDLESLLEDPLTQLMMEKDGVSEDDLRDIIEHYQETH